jgi:hypothetical protein
MALPFDEEEFTVWRENPITSLIFDVILADEIQFAKDHYFKQAWDFANLDPVFRAGCRERAKLADQLITLEYEDIESIYERRNESK